DDVQYLSHSATRSRSEGVIREDETRIQASVLLRPCPEGSSGYGLTCPKKWSSRYGRRFMCLPTKKWFSREVDTRCPLPVTPVAPVTRHTSCTRRANA